MQGEIGMRNYKSRFYLRHNTLLNQSKNMEKELHLIK